MRWCGFGVRSGRWLAGLVCSCRLVWLGCWLVRSVRLRSVVLDVVQLVWLVCVLDVVL